MKIRFINIVSGAFLLLGTLSSGINVQAQELSSGIYNNAKIAEGSAHTVISGDEIRKTAHTQLGAALAGRVAGLYIQTTDYEPGSENYVLKVRGASTTSAKAPLILLDGFKIANLNMVNVNDVERVTLLKDAAAVALYGIQAANGVVLIETKRGIEEGTVISVGVRHSIQRAAVTPTMLTSAQYARLLNEATLNDEPYGIAPYTEGQIEAFESGENRDLYPSHNWYDEYMQKYVNTTNAYITARGGSEYVNYFTSVDYTTQGSPFKTDNSYDSQYGSDVLEVRTNLDVKLNDYITAYMNAQTAIATNVITNNGNAAVYSSIFGLKPMMYGPTSPDGKVIVDSENGVTSTPYGMLNRSGYKKQTATNVSANLGVNFDLGFITDGLKAKVDGAFLNSLTSNMTASEDHERWEAFAFGDQLDFVQYGSTKDEAIVFSKGVASSYSAQFNGNLSYDKSFGKHRIGAAAIVSYYYAMNQAYQFSNFYLGGSIQASYAFDNLFYLDLAASTQGSDQFEANNRYGFFPSASAAWKVSNHDFLKDNELLTSLKLRASYGIVGYDGFDADAGTYIYKGNINRDGGKYIANLGTAIAFEKYANPDLTWERSKILNIGFDAELFEDFSLSFDYFHNNRVDILAEDTSAPLMGGIVDEIRPWTNAGEVVNSGFEVMLGYNKQLNSDLSIGVNAYAAFSRNKMIKSSSVAFDDTYFYSQRNEGYALGQLWGYQIDYSNGSGYFNSHDEITQSGLTYEGVAPRPGDFIYVDLNGDHVINNKDMAPMGKTGVPEWTYGLEYSMKWKNFDMSALFTGIAGVNAFNNGLGYYESTSNRTFFTRHQNAWTAERYANGETISAPALSLNLSASQKPNDYYLADKSYFKLSNLQIGYNIPHTFFDNTRLRVYATGMNLFTIDAFGSDDMHVENSKLSAFPTYKYYTVGLDINF